MGEAVLKQIEVGQLHAHPDNPRLVIRQDVVDGIAANLNGAFREKHAIHVRPIDGGYQVLSGHHRLAAAKLRDMKTIPAWVEDLDDNTAFMELVLSNNQGELSPLEIGMHALKAVPKSDGGRGKRGGLRAYAESVGKDEKTLRDYYRAAQVVAGINCGDIPAVLDKTHHLAAIHAAPTFEAPEDWPADTPWYQPVWQTLVDLMLSRNWTVADTKQWVSKLADFDIPEDWQFFLNPVTVMTHFLTSREFSARTWAQLVAEAEMVFAVLNTADANGADTSEERQVFRAWLIENAGPKGAAWDQRKIIAYRNELEARLKEKAEEENAAWNHGSWADHIPALEDGGVALLLTDPPYGIGYQSDHRLDRKNPRKHKILEGDDSLESLQGLITTIFPKLAANAHALVFCHWRKEAEVVAILTNAGLTVRGSLIWAKNNTGMGDPSTTFAPKHERIIHAVKGSPKLYEREADVLMFDRCNSDRHPTEKPVALLSRLIEVTTTPGQLVVDPFGGVASTLVAAKEMGRKYWGCEVDDVYFAAGKERIEGATP